MRKWWLMLIACACVGGFSSCDMDEDLSSSDSSTYESIEHSKLRFTLNEDGQSYSVAGAYWFDYTGVSIPSTNNNLPVTNIDTNAFSYCKALTSIEIPDTVTMIGNEAFKGCSSLINIVLPDSVTSIGEAAFDGCTSLTKVELGKSIKNIGKEAFNGCDSLNSIVIPDSVTNIGDSAFVGCKLLNTIEINSQVVLDAFKNAFVGGFESETVLSSVKIGGAVTSIGEETFQNCGTIASVIIDDSVTTIGDRAFYNCYSLRSVEIGDSVTSIGDHAFYNCCSLRSVEIGDSITTIGNIAFGDCNLLEYVTYMGDLVGWCGITFEGYYSNPIYNAEEFYIHNQLVGGNLLIPDTVTEIKSNAFSGYGALTSVEIPDSVTSIDSYAFHNCDSLRSISVSENNGTYKSIDGNLYTKDGKILLQYAPGKVGAFIIPSAVRIIGESAFSSCDSLTSVVIPDSVISIGDWAFSDCTSLASVEMGDSVMNIGYFAFYVCESLISVVIPDSVTSIDSYVFAFCKSLTSVVIPDSVTSIGSSSFDYCTSLTSVYYHGTAEGWDEIAIASLNCGGLTEATTYYYSETETSGGWHYVDGVPTVW